MRFFSIDNPVIGVIIKITDCILLSVLWLVFSLPIITVGASSAALYNTVYRYLRKNEGYLLPTFWKSFCENLRRSTILWMIAMGVQGLFIVDVLVFRSMAIQGAGMGRLYWPMLLLCGVALTWVVYLTAYAARFTGTVKEVLKFSLLLMFWHPVRAAGVLLTALAELLLIIMGPGLVLILPAVACLICSFIIEKVFLLHMSEEDVKKTLEEDVNL